MREMMMEIPSSSAFLCVLCVLCGKSFSIMRIAVSEAIKKIRKGMDKPTRLPMPDPIRKMRTRNKYQDNSPFEGGQGDVIHQRVKLKAEVYSYEIYT